MATNRYLMRPPTKLLKNSIKKPPCVSFVYMYERKEYFMILFFAQFLLFLVCLAQSLQQFQRNYLILCIAQ